MYLKIMHICFMLFSCIAPCSINIIQKNSYKRKYIGRWTKVVKFEGSTPTFKVILRGKEGGGKWKSGTIKKEKWKDKEIRILVGWTLKGE